jgi:hypothetical protein
MDSQKELAEGIEQSDAIILIKFGRAVQVDGDHKEMIVAALRSAATRDETITKLEAELASCRACRDKIDCLSRGEV